MKSVLLLFITDESEATYTNVEVVHIFNATNVVLSFYHLVFWWKKYFIILSHNNIIINNDNFASINEPTLKLIFVI